MGCSWPGETMAVTSGDAWPAPAPAAGLAAVLVWGLLAVPAARPAGAQVGENDPIEPVNRAVFEFNRVLDGLLLEPAAIMYRTATPSFVRTGVANFLNNLRTPVVLANDLLQGEFGRAERTLGRFMLNTILGFGGLIDVGGWAGMPDRHDEDFGQTLARLRGRRGALSDGAAARALQPARPHRPGGRSRCSTRCSSSPRPTSAMLASAPTSVSFRERNLETIDELERSSLDLYAATRTLVRQLRANEIRNGAPAPIEDIYDEDLYELDEGGADAPVEPDDPYQDPEDDDAR